MTPPRIKVCRIRMAVFRLGHPVEVKYELIGREIEVAKVTFDTLGSRTVVPRRLESPSASPATGVLHIEVEIIGEFRWNVVFKERLDESFCLPLGYHTTPT